MPPTVHEQAAPDEVVAVLDESARSFGAGNLTAARRGLQDALHLVAQRMAERLCKAMPEPRSGWMLRRKEANASTLGPLGGNVEAFHRYENLRGQTVDIRAVVDAPQIPQVQAALANPASANAPGRVVRVAGHRAVQTADDQLRFVVDNRILVTVGGSAPEEARLAFAQAIDFAALAAP